MITREQVENYVKHTFNEQDGSDRIDDKGFAYYIDTQPREYLDTNDPAKLTLGNGPIVIVKESGDIYSFSSNPMHMFGLNGVSVNNAKTADEFTTALDELKSMGDSSANSVDRIS